MVNKKRFLFAERTCIGLVWRMCIHSFFSFRGGIEQNEKDFDTAFGG